MALTLSAYEKIVNMEEWYYMDYKARKIVDPAVRPGLGIGFK